MKQTKKLNSMFVYGAVILTVLITIVVSWFLYQVTINLLTENLKGQLIAIVKTAAIEFEADDLAQLNVEEDYKKPEWTKIVTKLIQIRESNKDIVFAYILRKTRTDESQMEFVADSHSLDPYAKIDLDGNGIIDDSDALNWPGQTYEDVPSEAYEGYEIATTNGELYEDQWGILISGYAPIKNKAGETVAIMVVDMRADNFYKITQQTFFPFLLFIAALVIILLVQAGSLIRISSRQIALMTELDKQKDELLSIVSHQLAAPITAVKWYLEELLSGDVGKLEEEQKEVILDMVPISTNLSDLVSMILDVSRIQLGKMKIEKSSIDLNEFFKEILNIIEPKVQEKKINFIKDLPQKLPVALIDKRLTRMVVENLLTNAVKYTPNGGKVSFSARIVGDNLVCKVQDNGCGIPLSEQSKIFGKLFRASNVRDTVEGNGFGLYVAKGAIENQGGKISFISTEGKGTTFEIILPVKN